jgi:hypothetical protein
MVFTEYSRLVGGYADHRAGAADYLEDAPCTPALPDHSPTFPNATENEPATDTHPLTSGRGGQ